MGSFNFNYADKQEIASKGFILIPEFAQEYFKTDKIKVIAYNDYGNFKVKKNKFVNLHVIQGIVLSIYENEIPDFQVEEVFFSEYDYKSKLEKYRIKSIYDENLSCIFGKYNTTSKCPMKVVTDENLSYETTPYATVSGQFTKYSCPAPAKIVP